MTAGGTARATHFATLAARAALIALGAAIPVSTTADGILVGVILLGWLAAGRFRETIAVVRHNPAATVACVWFVVHVAAALYSNGSADEIGEGLSNAAMFLLVPIAVVLVRPADTRRAHYAFLGAIGVTLLLSYGRWAGIVPLDLPPLKPTNDSVSVVFKLHLTQNVLLALGAFVFAVYARCAPTPLARRLSALCAALSAFNVLIVGDGRTGQVILLALAVYYGGWLLGRRGVFAGALIATVLGAAAFEMPGTSLSVRVDKAIDDAASLKIDPTGGGTSVGQRAEFYRRAGDIIAENAIFGVGTGGFPAADREHAARVGARPTAQPHNQYLLQAAELGILGPVLMLALFAVPWRAAAHLADRGDTAIARGFIIAYGVGSLASAMLSDHAELILYVWMSAVLFASYKRARR